MFSRTHVLLWDWQFLSGELGSACTIVNGSTFTTNQATNRNAERIDVYRSLSNDAKNCICAMVVDSGMVMP